MKVNRLSAENTNAPNYETRGRRREKEGMKKLRRETTRENKVEEGKREAREQDGAWEDIFALSSRARSYYRHTWCNILPLIFASVRGFLPWPRRDFTSTHTVRDATGGSLPRRRGGEVESGWQRADDRMLPKFTKSREDDTSILATLSPSPNPAPFRFRSRRSLRSREKFARRSGVALRARDRAAGIARRHSASALLSTCFRAASANPGYRPFVSRNNGFRTQGLLAATVAFFLRLDRSSLARTTESPSPCVASDSRGTCFDLEAVTVVTV